MTYLGRPYYPWWLDNLADDVTGEGAAMQGVAKGAEAVRTIVVAAKKLYEDQDSASPAITATAASSRSTRVGSAASLPAS